MCKDLHRSMSRNEDVYPEPEVFRPERFLDLTKTELDNIDPKDFTFGFGRRLVFLPILKGNRQ